ncbi:pectate lyase [Microbulbifer rhizosphaerae]|uniref:PelA/Pel-15E family pectate lyase n=1 Tax=Microbulbifer rhizosphaerae TaxID=1562603 RepID=A0A7W4WFZ0_9GAMM|nr:pectate lyase [Microbulbifer rhizosphaerae]MBB3063519.1 PelA/Pel-15E family pectate lyase [Microbulbifer rhizosphaerae]
MITSRKKVFYGLGFTLLLFGSASLQAQTGDNLSIGAGADGSSKLSGTSYGNVIDGDTGTYWTPDSSTGRVSVKWPSATTVGSAVIREAAGFEGNIGSWQMVNHNTGDVLASGAGAGTINFSSTSLTKLNFEILSSNGTPAVAEFETYESSSSGATGSVNLAVSVSGADATLNWDVSDIDVSYQSVYRDTDPNPQGRTRIVANVAGNSYTDRDLPDGTYYYWIKVVDSSGNAFNSNGDDAVISTTTTLNLQESSGFCSVDGSIDSNHAGFTGSGFVNTDNKLGASVTYSINSDSAQSVQVDIRYASTSNRPANIEVNGSVVGTVNFNSSGAWTNWTTESVTIPLQAGENNIRLVAQTADGLPNIDSLAAVGASLTPGACGAGPDTADCNDVTGVPVITVAKDGSGQYSTVQAAINSVSSSNSQPTHIRIKPGVYYEKLVIDRPNLTLCGETGKTASTVLTYNDTSDTPDGNGGTLGTFGSTSVAISADDISVENITMENSHGPGIQAVAVRITSDRVQFRNARFLGNQDTLYVHSGSQYFKDCYVEGTVDYIFGRAAAVFDNCQIHSVGGGTSITAPSTEQTQPYGIVFLGGKVTASSSVSNGSVALGRNWRPYGSATYLGVDLGAHILPEGWRPMGSNTLDTARFAEYENTGPGADTSQRVPQSRQLSFSEAANYTVENIFDSWVPSYSNSNGDSASAPLLSQEGNPVHDRFNRYLTEWSLSTNQADIILSYQYDNGGWPKNQSYSSMGSGGSGPATIDNGATTLEMTYMAEMYKRTGNTTYRDSARRAMDYLLEMQYSTGGWPQFYPLRGGYSDHVTFNDNAMTRVLTALYHAERGSAPFDTDVFNSSDRAQFRTAIDKGVEYTLRAQWRQNGALTVWCAQHGATDYLPKAARAYELESLSGSESVEIIAFLMTQPQTPEIEAAVKSALAWYRSPNTILEDYTYDKSTAEKIISSPGDRMWYRFYDLDTNQGFFSDRDGGKYYDIMEISEERREGYSWGGGYGERIISYAESVGY